VKIVTTQLGIFPLNRKIEEIINRRKTLEIGWNPHSYISYEIQSILQKKCGKTEEEMD
jgi:hypothetical protein